MFNKAQIIGRLGQDPKISYTPQGTETASFSVATSETWTKDGEKKEKTEWHRVVAWDKLADICGKYLSKGSLVFIEGKIQTRAWEDKEGAKHSVTEIIAKTMKMLGGKSSEGAVQREPGVDSAEAGEYQAPDDDVPF
jgi:single-strand DNA-binding protein